MTKGKHMLKTALLVVAASAVTLAGCAGLPEKGAGPRVTNVTVENGYVVIDQEPIVIRGKGRVTWNVITPGYEFAPNGIEFKNPGPPYKDAADECRCAREGKREGARESAIFHCDAAHSQRGAMYRYTIRVQPLGGGRVIEFDPTAMND